MPENKNPLRCNRRVPMGSRATRIGGEMPRRKKPRGRPVKLTMPEPIDDTPENVPRAVLNTPPKKRDEWEFMKRFRAGQ